MRCVFISLNVFLISSPIGFPSGNAMAKSPLPISSTKAIPTAVPTPKASSNKLFFDASLISVIVIGRSVTSNPLARSISMTLKRVMPERIEPLKSGVINFPPILKKIFIVPTS